jgi:hypothetical protein
MKISIEAFKGQIPAIANNLLPMQNGQQVINAKSTKGDLRPWSSPLKDTATTETSLQTILQYEENSNTNWVFFPEDVNYILSPLTGEAYERLYFTGLSEPRVFANDLASSPFDKDTDYYKMGIPRPTAALTITQITRSTGTADTDTASKLVDSGADFVTDGVVVGDIAYNTTDSTEAMVTAVDNLTTLSLSSDAFPDGNENYIVGKRYTAGSDYRAYVYIFVNSYGEKGAPYGTTVVSISNYGSGDVPVEGFQSAPATRQIDKIYLYRTSASSAGTASYRFVLEATWFSASVSYSVGDYVIYSNTLYKCTTTHAAAAWDATHFTFGDDVTDANLSTDTLESDEWDPPPATMKGLIILPNGIAAGFVGNDVYLSEPYQVHAFPTSYIVSIPQTVIGLGHYGNNIVVATNGNPYVISGLTPSQMSLRKLKGIFPCLSKRSIVSSEFGTQFVTREGMVRINENGLAVDTAGLLDPSDIVGYNPTTMAGVVYSGKYFGFYHDADLALKRGFIIDYAKGHITELDFEIYCGYISEDDGQLYIGANDEYDETDPPASKPLCVKQWEGDTVNYLYFRFKSRRFILPYETNFAVARIMYDEEFYATIVAQVAEDAYLASLNATLFAGDILGAINDNAINELDINGDILYDLSGISIDPTITFKIYADGVLQFTKNVTNNKIFKLNSGYKSKRYDFQIEGNIPVKRMDVATSVEEIIIQ